MKVFRIDKKNAGIKFCSPFPIMFQPITLIDRLERICAFCVGDLPFSSVNKVSRSTWHVLIYEIIEY